MRNYDFKWYEVCGIFLFLVGSFFGIDMYQHPHYTIHYEIELNKEFTGLDLSFDLGKRKNAETFLHSYSEKDKKFYMEAISRDHDYLVSYLKDLPCVKKIKMEVRTDK